MIHVIFKENFRKVTKEEFLPSVNKTSMRMWKISDTNVQKLISRETLNSSASLLISSSLVTSSLRVVTPSTPVNSFSFSAFMSVAITEHPSSTNLRAVARPIPVHI